MDRLECIRIFLEVAEQRSFAEAARKLGLAPVMTSRAVAALERELGAVLLRRTTRSVSLTKHGAEYVARGRRALADLEDAARAIRSHDAHPRGQLVITAPALFGRMFVMPIVTSLLSDHPELSVRVILSDRVMRLAEEGIDVAVRIGHLADSALRAARLAAVTQVWVASPDYVSRRGLPRAAKEFRGHDLIQFDSATLNKGWIRVKGKPVEARLRTDNAEASIDAAIRGMGIARLFSYQVKRHISEGRLIRVLPNVEKQSVPINLVYLANRVQSPGLRAFMAAARNALPGFPEL